MVLADTGHGVYRWVYASSMVSVLAFGITKGFTFTKTTLMASSSLHDRMFDKVRLGPLRNRGVSHGLTERQQARALCWAQGTDRGAWEEPPRT